MTRQEEIKEGAILSLMKYKGFERLSTEHIIDHVFNHLHSQGVAIRVVGELPKRIWYGDFGGESGEAGYTLGLRDMADYCKTEPLIEDNET